MKNPVHIIEKVLVEVVTRKVETANIIKNNVSVFLEEKLFPEVETALTFFDDSEVLVRVDSLDIRLSLPETADFSAGSTVSEKVKEQIRQQVSEQFLKKMSGFGENEKPGILQFTPQENREEIFLFFLENGFYPWYGNSSHVIGFTENKNWEDSFNNPAFIGKLKELLKKNGVFQRFAFQYPFKIVYIFLSHINSRIIENIQDIQKLENTFRLLIRTELLNALFFVSTEINPLKITVALEKNLKQIEPENLKVQRTFIRQILNATPESVLNAPEFSRVLDKMRAVRNRKQQNISAGKTKQPHQNTEIEVPVEINGVETILAENEKGTGFFNKDLNKIHVRNAGLVLLHPFFKQLFTVLDFLDTQNRIKADKTFEAVQVLYYLATGGEEAWEGDLVFEKFICGVPLHFTLPRQSFLTTKMKNEAEILLKEVIKNWPELKNTSVGGLQQMFLSRNGILLQTEGRFKLIVERKAQDVLLEKLNWNITILKFSWRKELITVEW